ncbi:cytochrome P450 [Gongronella butleri]|nr:cytochrome P450 [Gongronella butleri]
MNPVSAAIARLPPDMARLFQKEHAKRIGASIALTWFTVKLATTLYRGFFGPLSHLPGHWITRFIVLPRLRADGKSYLRMKEFLDEYGTVARLGPNIVVVSDKRMIRQVLSHEDYPKGPGYQALRETSAETMFNTQDKLFHRQRRRIVSPAFSIKYLNSLEPFMDDCLRAMLTRLDNEIDASPRADGYVTIDLWKMLGMLALDIIGSTAFGESFDMVNDSDHYIPTSINNIMRAAAKTVMFPRLIKFLRLIGLGFRDEQFEQFVRAMIMKRLNSKERREDILQILIDSNSAANQDDRLTVDAIMSEVVLFLIAGAETTSNTTGLMLIELLRHPDKMAALRAEIDALTSGQRDALIANDQLKQLPYLNAVMYETMRLHSIASTGLQRMTAQDTILGDHLHLPKNTIVICGLNHAHRNPEYWQRPDDFVPERWLPGAETEPCLEAYFPFSIGSRNCIGRQFALQEMRLVLATLVQRYELKPIPVEMDHAKDLRQYFTLGVEGNTFKVDLRHRGGQAA